MERRNEGRREREGGRAGGERGKERGTATRTISRCGAYSLSFCSPHELPGMTQRKLFSGTAKLRTVPRSALLPAGSHRNQPLQGRVRGNSPVTSRQQKEVTGNLTGQSVPAYREL